MRLGKAFWIWLAQLLHRNHVDVRRYQLSAITPEHERERRLLRRISHALAQEVSPAPSPTPES